MRGSAPRASPTPRGQRPRAGALAHARPGRASSKRIRIENDTSGAQAGVTTAMVSDSLTPMSSPASERAERVGQAADDHHREHHADPRPDLGRGQRGDQRDVAPGHPGVGRADAGEQEGLRAGDSPRRRRPWPGPPRCGAQRLADVGEAQPRPRARTRAPPRSRQARSSRAGRRTGPSRDGRAGVGRLVAAEVRRPEPLDDRLDDDGDPEGDQQRGELRDAGSARRPRAAPRRGRRTAGTMTSTADPRRQTAARCRAGRSGRRRGRRGQMAEVDQAQEPPATGSGRGRAGHRARPSAGPRRPTARGASGSARGGFGRGAAVRAEQPGPGAANSLGHTTTHLPSCTCFTLDRSSP